MISEGLVIDISSFNKNSIIFYKKTKCMRIHNRKFNLFSWGLEGVMKM